MDRRDLLRHSGLAALLLGAAPLARTWGFAADAPKKKVLMFTRSVGFQHSVVKRDGDKLSVLPLDEALVSLDRIWDNFFPFDGERKATSG